MLFACGKNPRRVLAPFCGLLPLLCIHSTSVGFFCKANSTVYYSKTTRSPGYKYPLIAIPLAALCQPTKTNNNYDNTGAAR